MRGKKRTAVVGAGPAGLMAAEVAARGGAEVTVFDRMPSPGRKLLLAGRGGLNLTHSESEPRFLARYGEAAQRLAPIIECFGPSVLREWCTALGVGTFVGSSGRVFPVSFKTSPLLRAWLRRLAADGVVFRLRHEWSGWRADGQLRFLAGDQEVPFEPDATILALGGASWPHLGSDGRWVETLCATGADVKSLRPANCGFTVPWTNMFLDKFEGQPLKNVELSTGAHAARGDVVMTRSGIEGSPVYALTPTLREIIERDGGVTLHVALRPDLTEDALATRLGARRAKASISNVLRQTLGLSPVAIGLLHEVTLAKGERLADVDLRSLARLVNDMPIRLTGPMPIARAISTAGGIAFAGLDAHLMLRSRPGLFVAGEMVDWEAPTGGYLLQACFATGATAAEGALAWLARAERDQPASAVA